MMPLGGAAFGIATRDDDVAFDVPSGRSPQRHRRARHHRPSLGSWNGAEERGEEEARLHRRRRSAAGAAASTTATAAPPSPSGSEPPRASIAVDDGDRRFDDDLDGDDPLDVPLPLSSRRMRRGRRAVGRPGLVVGPSGGGPASSAVVPNVRIGPSVVFPGYLRKDRGCLRSIGAGPAATGHRDGDDVDDDRSLLRGFVGSSSNGRGGGKSRSGNATTTRTKKKGTADVFFLESSSSHSDSSFRRRRRRKERPALPCGTVDSDEVFGRVGEGASGGGRRRGRSGSAGSPGRVGRRVRSLEAPYDLADVRGAPSSSVPPRAADDNDDDKEEGRVTISLEGLADELLKDFSRRWSVADDDDSEAAVKGDRDDAEEEGDGDRAEDAVERTRSRSPVVDRRGRRGRSLEDGGGPRQSSHPTTMTTALGRSGLRPSSVPLPNRIAGPPSRDAVGSGDVPRSHTPAPPGSRRDADPRDTRDNDAVAVIEKDGSARTTSRVRPSERRSNDKEQRGPTVELSASVVRAEESGGGDDDSRRRRKKKRRRKTKVVKMHRRLLEEQSSLQSEQKQLEDRMRDVDAKLSAAEEEEDQNRGRRVPVLEMVMSDDDEGEGEHHRPEPSWPSSSVADRLRAAETDGPGLNSERSSAGPPVTLSDADVSKRRAAAPERASSSRDAARTKKKKSELNELRSKMRRIEAEREGRRIALIQVEKTINANTTDIHGLRRELAKCMPGEIERQRSASGQRKSAAIHNDRTATNKDRTIEELEQEVNVKEGTIEALEAWVEAAQEELAESESRRLAAEGTFQSMFEGELRRLGNEIDRLRERSERSEERATELEGRVLQLEEALRRRGGPESGAVAVVNKSSTSLPRLLREDKVVAEAPEEGRGHIMERERGIVEAPQECEVSNDFEALPEFHEEAAACSLVASEEGAIEDAQSGPRIKRKLKVGRGGTHNKEREDAERGSDPPALMGEDSVEKDCATPMLATTGESVGGAQRGDTASSNDEDSIGNAGSTYDDGGQEGHGEVPESGRETAEPSDANIKESLGPASSQRDIDAHEPRTDLLGKSVDASEMNRNRGKLAEVIAEYHKSKKASRRTLATVTTAESSSGWGMTATATDEGMVDSVDPARHCRSL